MREILKVRVSPAVAGEALRDASDPFWQELTNELRQQVAESLGMHPENLTIRLILSDEVEPTGE